MFPNINCAAVSGIELISLNIYLTLTCEEAQCLVIGWGNCLHCIYPSSSQYDVEGQLINHREDDFESDRAHHHQQLYLSQSVSLHPIEADKDISKLVHGEAFKFNVPEGGEEDEIHNALEIS